MKHIPAAASSRARAALWPVLWVAAFALLLVGTLGRAIAKPLWHDELFTLYIAAEPTVTDIWRALAAGVDLNPPLYHLLVHWCVGWLGPTAVAVRLPALAGFLLATVAIYAFTRRHAGAPVALFASMVPSLTGAYLYAYEGRPYGLVLGLGSLALLGWQQRDREKLHRLAPLVCAAAVAGATYAHYYGVLLLVPVAAGELARVATRRRIDWPMWIAFGLAGLSALGLLPLMRSARGFGATFWSRPSVGDLVGFYDLLLEPLALVLLVAALILLTAIALRSWWWTAVARRREVSAPEGWPLPLEETAVLLALVATPIVGYLLSVFVTGAFHERYVLYGVIGFAVLAAASLQALPLGRRQVSLFVLVCLLAVAGRQGTGILAWINGPQDPMADHRALLARIPPGPPVVVSHALVFLPLAHYEEPVRARRLTYTYLMRPPEVVRRSGVDTGGRALERLSKLVRLDVRSYEAFLREQHRFFVYGPQSWLVPQLLNDGADLQLVAQRGDMSLFRVTAPGQRGR